MVDASNDMEASQGTSEIRETQEIRVFETNKMPSDGPDPSNSTKMPNPEV